MSEFIAELLVYNDDTTEGIYAGSGSSPNPAIPEETTPIPTPQQKCWVDWKCTWTGHNNGGHSICHVSARHDGDHTGNTIVMNFSTNFDIADVKNTSGCTISSIGLRAFTLIRNGHFNGNDNIGFNFEIVTSTPTYDAAGNLLHGAIGENNASTYYCALESFSCS